MSDVSIPTPGHGLKLTGKLGPLPVWTWGLIVGLIVVAVYVLRSKATNTDNADASTTVASALDPSAGNYTTDGLDSNLSQSNTTNASQTTDNTAWLAQAQANVSNKTGASPVLVSAALQKYINGSALTQAEQKWVDTAISLTGQPPEGVDGISTVTVPTTGAATGGTGTTTTTKPPVTSKPAPVKQAMTKNETEADRLYLALLGRHIVGPGQSPANTTAVQYLNEGKSSAYVEAWIKKSAEYKQKHPKG